MTRSIEHVLAKTLPWFLWLFVGLLGPSAAWSSGSGERLSVYVVNYPLKYFAERVGGEHVSVVFPVSPGGDPAFWKPTTEMIAAYQGADLVLLNGASYAKWTAMASLPRRRLVDTSRGFVESLIAIDHVAHRHGTSGSHAHGNLAFTTWLDFTQAAAQARAIMEAFVRRRPHLRASFERNFDGLQGELLALDGKLRAMARGASKRPLLASHPVYQYLARRYGLNLRSVHWEPDQVPQESDWVALAALLAQHPARWMIWEEAPAPATLGRLQAMGVDSVVFSPCASAPEQGDFMSIMRANIERLQRVF